MKNTEPHCCSVQALTSPCMSGGGTQMCGQCGGVAGPDHVCKPG